MDKSVQELVDAKQFMGTVLVARGDDLVLNKAYGHANLEWDIPNTTNTKFRLGSVTKQFTAAGILLLEERGKLRVEDPIKKFVKDAPGTWDSITLNHLLTHTSGIPNFTNGAEFQKLKQFPTAITEMIGWFRDKPLDFQPGEKMSYSNSGYILLGFVIESVSGQSYAEFVQQNIFAPLGMNDSGYDSNSAIIERRASGYTNNGKTFLNADFVHMSIPHAAGALYSTTADLLRWQRGLYGNKLLRPESVRKMMTPFKDGYALGITIGESDNRKFVRHGGGIEGFNTELVYYPDTQITIAALSNVNGSGPSQIVSKLGPMAHGANVTLTSERKEIAVPAETLKKYVGTYSIAPNVTVMVRLDGNQLTTQVSGQPKTPAFAESETRFFLKVVDAQFEFSSGPEGKVTHLMLYQNGREIKAQRVSDTVSEKQEIALPVATLRDYVGTYTLRPGLDLVFKIENDQLILQPTNQQQDRMFAEAKDKFFSKFVDASIEFVRDEQGKVTELTLKQGSFNGKAKKK
jgi:CubicO group peptidase (beta-lactamase class C family)